MCTESIPHDHFKRKTTDGPAAAPADCIGFYLQHDGCRNLSLSAKSVKITQPRVEGYKSWCAFHTLQGDHHIYPQCHTQQRGHTNSDSDYLIWPGAANVTGIGIDFSVAGLNLNIITLIKGIHTA